MFIIICLYINYNIFYFIFCLIVEYNNIYNTYIYNNIYNIYLNYMRCISYHNDGFKNLDIAKYRIHNIYV